MQVHGATAVKRRVASAVAYAARLLAVGLSVGSVIVVGGLTKLGLDDYLHPARIPADRTPASLGLPYQDVALVTEDGLRLVAWYLPGEQPESLILVHGLGGNRASQLPLAKNLHERGYNLLLLELRAHGESDGNVSTLGVKEVRDVRAAMQFLQQQPEVDPRRIGIYGESLGSAVALLATAALPDVRAVVADSTYASARWLVDHQLSALLNLPDWFGGLLLLGGSWEAGIDPDAASPRAAAAQLGDRPLLLIHGVDDGLFRLDNAQLVYDAAAGPRELWVVDGVGHSGAYGHDPAGYTARLDSFFGAAL